MRFVAKVVGQRRIGGHEQVVLDHVRLEQADFSGRRLVQFSATGSRFANCDFSDTSVESASFGAGREISEYVDSSFDRSRITFAVGGYTRFIRCSFRDVQLRNWMCFTVELVDCVFTGVIRTAVFNGTVPPDDRKLLGRAKNEFRGNDFSGCELIDVGFRSGIDLDA